MKHRIYICKGSDCSQHDHDNKFLRKTLSQVADVKVKKVRCQKICHGPVVGVPVKGILEWFRELNTYRDTPDLLAVAQGKKPSSSLWSKRVKKRSGKLR